MANPNVTITEKDGALGVLPPSAGKLLVVVGPSSSGTANTPTAFGKVKDLVAAFGTGPMVERAARSIEIYGRSVLVVRTATATTTAVYSAITKVGTGTSVATADAAVKPYDSYEVKILVVNGGTIGVAGITFQYSLDAGRSYSPVTALGTATNYTIASGNVKLNFAAGTMVAGDTYSCVTTQAIPTTAEIGLALDPLAVTTQPWELALMAFPLDASLHDAVDAKILAMQAYGRDRAWIGGFRVPDPGESEATYLAAFVTAFGAKAQPRGAVCYGAFLGVSSVSGLQLRFPVAHCYGPLEASLREEQNAAAVELGAIPGVSIRDANGNLLEHDELASPGGDDARGVTLTTQPDYPGVYITRPRLLSAPDSDYTLMPYRRVMNLGKETVRKYFRKRLNRVVYVNPSTGFIDELEARAMEKGCEASLRAVLGGTRPKASGWTVAVSRTDNILSTKKITVTVRIIPVGYSEYFDIEMAFENPLLVVKQSA